MKRGEKLKRQQNNGVLERTVFDPIMTPEAKFRRSRFTF